MNGKIKKIKDTLSKYIYPVTVGDAVFVEPNKTLTQKLTEIGVGGGSDVVDSTTNGNIVVNGQELIVYDDTTLESNIAAKANLSHKHDSSDIIDFDTTNKTVGYALQFDTTSGKFVSKALPSGVTAEAQYLNELLDVDTVTLAPSEGDAMVFQGGVWKPGKVESKQANAEVPLFIETPASGLNQPIHPKVVAFASNWNGYKYWMAYTPYPNANAENPCIAKSADCIRWYSITANPLDTPRTGIAYWSDTHLLFNPDTNKLECWYRGVNSSVSPYQELIYRRTTSDGATWDVAELMFTMTNVINDAVRAICPCIIYETGKYRIWAGYDRNSVRYYETPDGKNWQYIATCSGGGVGGDWHFDFEKTDQGIEYVGGGSSAVYHAVSTDGLTFTGRKTLLTLGRKGNWDDLILYRPCLMKVNRRYHLFYTGQNMHNKHIGLTIAEKDDDITSLRGLGVGSMWLWTKPIF